MGSGTTTHLEPPASAPPCEARVVQTKGCPRLEINGHLHFPLLCWSWELARYTPAFRRAGINLINPYYQLSEGWRGPETYEWSTFFGLLEEVLKANPEAFFLPRLLLPAPRWWLEENSGECIRYAHPVEDEGSRRTIPLHGEGGIFAGWGGHHHASWASERYLKDMGNALADLVREVENTSWNRRIFGYQIGNGTTLGEWHYFGSHYLPDISARMVEKSGFAPSAEKRLTTTYGLLRDPAHEGDLIRYYEAFHRVCAQSIIHFAAIVKSAVPRSLVVGAFYDYQLESIWIQEGGHLAPEILLESDSIDFIAAPYAYQLSTRPGVEDWENDVDDEAGNWLGRARGVGGDGGYRPMTESLRRHGKLHVVEVDPSTYVETQQFHNGGSGSRTLQGTLDILSRDLGKLVATGSGGWLTDHGPRMTTGWYAEKPIVRRIREFSEIGRDSLDWDLSTTAEIVSVYQVKSAFPTEHWKRSPYFPRNDFIDFISFSFLNSQSRTLQRIGAPVDFLHLFDLADSDRHRYRLIFLPNAFYLKDAEFQSLHELLPDSGWTVVWYFAPGFIHPHRLDLSRMERLTGFSFDCLEQPGPLLIDLVQNSDAYPEMRFGFKRSVWPRFRIRDRGADVLGNWSDRSGPAFAIKKMNGWTSVYTGAAPLPVGVLRYLARISGCTLWSSKADIVFGGRECVQLIASSSGHREICLPRRLVRKGGTGAPAFRHRLKLRFGEVALFTPDHEPDRKSTGAPPQGPLQPS